MDLRLKIYLIVGLIVALGIGGVWYWTTKTENTKLPEEILRDFRILGVIDMDEAHRGFNVKYATQGSDVILLVDRREPFYTELKARYPDTLIYQDTRFHLKIYDDNRDGILDNTDWIWPHLYVAVFRNNGTEFEIKSLQAAGIHAIILKHLTAEGNHTVILSDGSERILYEKPFRVEPNGLQVYPSGY